MHINRTDLIMRLGILLALIVCNVFNWIPFFSWTAFGLYGLFMFMMTIRRPYFLLKYFFCVFASTAVIVGCTMCEFSGTYLGELWEWSHYVGSLPLLCTQHVIFYLVLMFFDGMSKMRMVNISPAHTSVNNFSDQSRTNEYLHYISILCVLVLLVMFLRIARNPAFILQMDRVEYEDQFHVKTGIFLQLANNASILVAFPMLDYFNGHKRTGKVGMTLYILYSLWNGNKFGPFMTFLGTFIIINYEQIQKIDRKKITKYVYVGLFAIMVLVLVAGALAANMWGSIIDEYLTMRTAQQGQLWWKTYAITDRTHLDEFDDELNGIFKPNDPRSNVGEMYGEYKNMYLCCNNSLYISWRLKGGTTYTSCGFACAYYYLMIPGVLIWAVFIAFLLSAFTNEILSAVKRRKYIRVVLLMKFLSNTQAMMSTFIFNGFFTPSSIITFLLLIADYCYEYITSRRTTPIS